MSDSILTAESLSYSYGDHKALDDLSFQVTPGSHFGLLGPNGSGKTTLFRLLATLLPPQEGSVSVCGFDLAQHPQHIRRQLGVTFQSPAIDPRLTVSENLICHGRIYGIPTRELTQRIDTLTEQFGIADRRSSIVSDLSGGLRRRVELAKGLLHAPRLLLLDEPGTGLDPAARRQFRDLIDAHRRQYGTTVILITHLMEEAEVCEQLLLLDRGRIVRRGTVDELQSSLDGDRLTVKTRRNEELRPELEQFLQTSARPLGDRLCFRLKDASEGLRRVLDRFPNDVISAEVARPTLEDVFLESTGRQLRGSDEETAE